jgi:alpha-tubulin suppressor-like RCC1 family protein
LYTALADVQVAEVACGAHHTFCLAADGRVYSFGHGEYGQQGTGDVGNTGTGRTRNALWPREFVLPRTGPARAVTRVVCGHLHTLFRTDDGGLWSCGWGVDGVLGHGDKKYRAVPAPIHALEGDTVAAAAAGWRHNLVVKVRPCDQ